jgi:uncharacterized protein YcfL
MKRSAIVVLALLLTVGCSGDDSDNNGTPTDTVDPDGATADVAEDTADDDGSTTNDVADDSTSDDGGGEEDAGDEDTTQNVECDWRTEDQLLVMQAESLPLNENWEVKTEFDGYTGDGYIEWTGNSHNNDPTNGVMEMDIHIQTPGRYRLQWYNRIGEGNETTEHNDTWVKFPDADDYYGLKGSDGAEVRRYPKPKCEDSSAMDPIRNMSDVETADCVRGSTRDGWLKVYSSGASDWKWSTRTSDNDASNIMVEFGEAGVYKMMMAARGDHHLIDRIVLHEESLSNDTVRDLELPETTCP